EAPTRERPRWSARVAGPRSGRETRRASRARRRRPPTTPRRRARGSAGRRGAGAGSPSAGPARARPRARRRRAVRTARRRAGSGVRRTPPGGGRSRAVCSGGQRRLGLLRELRERVGVADREVGEHLAVELDVGRLQPGDELVVREAVRAGAGVDPNDPEPPERALAVLAVAVRVDERVLDLLLRVLVVRALEAPVALGLLENLAARLARLA